MLVCSRIAPSRRVYDEKLRRTFFVGTAVGCPLYDGSWYPLRRPPCLLFVML